MFKMRQWSVWFIAATARTREQLLRTRVKRAEVLMAFYEGPEVQQAPAVWYVELRQTWAVITQGKEGVFAGSAVW